MIGKCLLMLALVMVDPGDIGKINATKAEAKKAYLSGDYKKAADRYQYLVDSAGVHEDEVMMNLGNSYFQLNDTTNAIASFQPLTLSLNNRLKSVANQQLGVLHNRQGKYEESLNYFKQALKSDPSNEDARFNYEMIKKKLKEQQDKQQQQQDKNKDNKENKDQEQKDQEQKDQEKKEQEDQQKKQDDQKKDSKEEQEKKKKEEQEKKDKEQKEKEQQEKQQDKKDIPPSVKEKLKDMDMSEEKARMILEAMKNQEVQYLQQNKRKATKPRDKGKPDW